MRKSTFRTSSYGTPLPRYISQKVFMSIENIMIKTKQNPYFIPYMTINSKWVKDLNTKS